MRDEVKQWLGWAKTDLKTAKKNFHIKVYYASSFFSQQAAEKALKALLLSRNLVIPKVHDLIFLAKNAGAGLEIVSKCDRLTWVYTETRYPDISEESPTKKFTKEVSREHVAIAGEIIRWVEKQI